MAIFAKNNIKNLLIILLLITNITTITTILVHGHRQHERMRDGGFLENPNHRTSPNRNFDPFMESELGLNAEQKDDFKILRHEFMEQSREVMEGMRDSRIQINEELKKENPDMETLNLAAEEIGNKHKKLKLLSFEMLFKMKKVCTEEQQEKLVEVFIEMQPKPFCKPKHQNKNNKNNKYQNNKYN